jgi:hypothetical protein
MRILPPAPKPASVSAFNRKRHQAPHDGESSLNDSGDRLSVRRLRNHRRSSREWRLIGLGVEIRHGLEPVVAGLAMPEIGHAVLIGFDPLRRGDRLAALGAGIFVGHIAGFHSGHGRLPSDDFFLGKIFLGKSDRTAVENRNVFQPLVIF